MSKLQNASLSLCRRVLGIANIAKTCSKRKSLWREMKMHLLLEGLLVLIPLKKSLNGAFVLLKIKKSEIPEFQLKKELQPVFYAGVYLFLINVYKTFWDLHLLCIFEICRAHDFSKSGFGPRTVIICDQVLFHFVIILPYVSFKYLWFINIIRFSFSSVRKSTMLAV